MSLGIIGGADGSTAIFISRNFSPWTIGAVIALRPSDSFRFAGNLT